MFFRNPLPGIDRRRRGLLNERTWLNSENRRLDALLDEPNEVEGTAEYHQAHKILTEDSSGDAEDDRDPPGPPVKPCGLTLRHIGVIFPARR